MDKKFFNILICWLGVLLSIICIAINAVDFLNLSSISDGFIACTSIIIIIIQVIAIVYTSEVVKRIENTGLPLIALTCYTICLVFMCTSAICNVPTKVVTNIIWAIGDIIQIIIYMVLRKSSN